MVVVGTGMSMAATGGDPRASWVGLLKAGIEFCERFVAGIDPRWGAAMRANVALGDVSAVISVAEMITDKLGGDEAACTAASCAKRWVPCRSPIPAWARLWPASACRWPPRTTTGYWRRPVGGAMSPGPTLGACSARCGATTTRSSTCTATGTSPPRWSSGAPLL